MLLQISHTINGCQNLLPSAVICSGIDEGGWMFKPPPPIVFQL